MSGTADERPRNAPHKADLNFNDLEPWLVQACEAAGVDRSTVDVGMALRLSREVAHRLARPMAPVSTFIVGIALAQQPDADPRELVRRIEATLPATADPESDPESKEH